MVCLKVIVVVVATLVHAADCGVYLRPYVVPPIVHYPVVHNPLIPHSLVPLKVKAALHGLAPYHHNIFLRSVKDQEEPSEDSEKFKENDNRYTPKVIVVHNGKTLYNSDNEENANQEKETARQFQPDYQSYYPQAYVNSYGQPVVLGPNGQQIMPMQQWVNRPSTDGVILDQSQSPQFIRPNLFPVTTNPFLTPQNPNNPQTPPNLATNPQNPPNHIDNPQVPPNHISISQNPPSNPQNPANPNPQNPFGNNQVTLPTFNNPLNPGLQQFPPNLIPLIRPNHHGSPYPQMITNVPPNPFIHQVPLEPITNHHHQIAPPHPNIAGPSSPPYRPHYFPHTAPAHNLPPVPPPQVVHVSPCSNSLYNQKNSRPLGIFNTNEYMDSIDKYLHPYIFTK